MPHSRHATTSSTTRERRSAVLRCCGAAVLRCCFGALGLVSTGIGDGHLDFTGRGSGLGLGRCR